MYLKFAAQLFLLSTLIAQAQEPSPSPKIHPSLLKLGSNETIPVVIWGKSQADVTQIHRVLEWRKLRVDRLDAELNQRRKRLDIAVARPAEVEAERDQELIGYRREVARKVEEELQPARAVLKAYLESLGILKLRQVPLVNAWSAEVDREMLGAMEASDSIAYVTPNQPMSLQLNRSSIATGAPAFWDAGILGQGESIAIIDSGIDSSHPMFAGIQIEPQVFSRNFPSNRCLFDNLTSPYDFQGHGTHVASIAAGRVYQWGDNWLAGVAPGIQKVYALKTLFRTSPNAGVGCEEGATGSPLDWVAALVWLTGETPTRIVNMSLGRLPPDYQVDNTTEDLYLDQVTSMFPDLNIVVAAGNEGKRRSFGTVGSPGNAYNILSVANYDIENDEITPESSKGPTNTGRRKPDLAAPGERIWGAARGSNSLVEMSGTSMAAPHVAGAIALVRQTGIQDPLRIKALLLNTSNGSGWLPDYGWGVMNLGRAFSQKDLTVQGRFEAGSGASRVHLYLWRPSESKRVTIAWNRFVDYRDGWIGDPYPDRVALTSYSASTGVMDRDSNIDRQNVQQLQATLSEPIILSVAALTYRYQANGRTLDYGLAYSGGSFEKLNGPNLSVSCRAPGGSINSGTNIRIDCTARNDGDTLAVNPQIQIFTSGGSLVSTSSLQSVPPGNARSASINYSTPATGGFVRLTAQIATNSFGLSHSNQSSLSFDVTVPFVPFRLRSFVVSQTLPIGCTAPSSAMNVSASTANVYAWASVEGANAGDFPTIDFISPNGSIYSTIAQRRVASTGDACFSQAMQVAGSMAAMLPGTWSARLRWNNSVVGTNNFIIVTVPAIRFSVRAMLVTLSVPGNCATPSGTNFATASTPSIYAWFAVDAASGGDEGIIEFISPDGVLYSSQSMGKTPSAGDWCGNRSISIAGTPAANRPGNWTTRLRWNGTVVATRNFELSPVKIDQALTTLSLPQSLQGCPTPQSNSLFSTQSGYAGLYFSLSNLSTGDQVSTQWISPRGATYDTRIYNPLGGPGSWCFQDWISIAGTAAAAIPGEWNAIGLVNGRQVFTLPFTIR